MNLLIITDAWHPQINGVVRTYEAIVPELEEMGHNVKIVGPDATRLTAFRMPFYPEIVLEFFARKRLERLIESFRPDAIHIATEGPLGWAAHRLCLAQNRPFTTAYHTRFPEYIATRFVQNRRKSEDVPPPLRGRLGGGENDWKETPKILTTHRDGNPPSLTLPARGREFLRAITTHLTYAILCRFHAPAQAVLVATPTIESELKQRGFKNTVLWPRGVDTNLFQPYGKTLSTYANLPRPILLYVGRVAVEKNLPAFLDLKTTGSKVVIGDGPDLDKLRKQYPEARFLGARDGETLARHFAAADLFVFPSKTDTFGLVLLEACAAGLRIASYPSPGPLDLFMTKEAHRFAVLNMDLQRAVDTALRLPDDPAASRSFAEKFSWKISAERLIEGNY